MTNGHLTFWQMVFSLSSTEPASRKRWRRLLFGPPEGVTTSGTEKNCIHGLPNATLDPFFHQDANLKVEPAISSSDDMWWDENDEESRWSSTSDKGISCINLFWIFSFTLNHPFFHPSTLPKFLPTFKVVFQIVESQISPFLTFSISAARMVSSCCCTRSSTIAWTRTACASMRRSTWGFSFGFHRRFDNDEMNTFMFGEDKDNKWIYLNDFWIVFVPDFARSFCLPKLHPVKSFLEDDTCSVTASTWKSRMRFSMSCRASAISASMAFQTRG